MKTILADCKVLQIPFVDVDFPPVSASLGGLVGGATLPAVVWLRPFSARPLVPLLEPGTSKTKASSVELLPELGTVVPGTLFGAGLSPLASAMRLLSRAAPHLIRALFKDHIPNVDGAIGVTLHTTSDDGGMEARRLVVDDLLPCSPLTQQPLCTATDRLSSIWPSAVEKAFAKLHGSFAAAHALPLAAVLEEICGFPVSVKKLPVIGTATPSEAAELWSMLHDAATHKRLACVATRANAAQVDEPLLLLEATAIVPGSNVRLLRLTGGSVSNASWGPTSPNWTPELRAKLLPPAAAAVGEHSCWVTLDELMALCEFATIVHGDADWRYSTLPLRLVRAQSLVAIDVTSSDGSDLLIAIHQSTAPMLGTRFCIMQADRPHKPFGGTGEAFVAAALHATERLRLPRGSYLGMLEVYRQHESRLPATVELTIATTAKKALVPKAVEYEGGKPPEWAFTLPEFARKNGQCAACGNALAGTIFTVQAAKFHDFCFVCSICSVALGTAIIVRDGKLFCQPCGNKQQQQKSKK